MKLVAKKDDGVSPVIGTILLVAITVVLVAIVAAVVMGMVGNVGNTKDVGVTVQPYKNDTTKNGVTVIIYGGQDAGKISKMNVNVEGGSVSYTATNPQIGKPYQFELSENKEYPSALVVVTGNFTDGTTSVLAQSTMTIPKAV